MQSQVVDDSLDVSRIISGKPPIAHEVVDFAAVVTTSIASAQANADDKSIQIDVSLCPLRAVVVGDARRLQQVVVNLLANAVKITPKGGLIRVQLRREDATAVLLLQDNGRGIPADLLPHIFDRFRQAEVSAARSTGGLGLGLAIVRHVVEAHGGTVKAESAGAGSGATFTVSLPLVDSGLENPPSRPPSLPSGASVRTPLLESVRVLVVEDDVDSCELLAVVFEDAGAGVHTAVTAQDALRDLTSYDADVLVSDVGLPEQDGYTLLRQIRALESVEGRRRLPVVALTAFASHVDRERAMAAGFDDYLAKPLDPNLLVQTVAKILGRSDKRGGVEPNYRGANARKN